MATPSAAPPPRSWAELPTDILTSVVDRDHTLRLRSHLTLRGVCTAWRSALPREPPYLIVGAGGVRSPSPAFSSPFRFLTLPKNSSCIGACHGWIAIAYSNALPIYLLNRDPLENTSNGHHPYLYTNFEGAQIRMSYLKVYESQNRGRKSFMALYNPVTGRRIELPQHNMLDPWKVDKVVFAPNPRPDDFTVVAAFGFNSLAYVSTRDAAAEASWSFGELPKQSVLADMVYREEEDGDKVYCLGRDGGDVHVLHVPRGRRPVTNPVITPLLPPELARVFPPPHATVSGILTGASARSLAFCGGDMYQVLRNNIGAAFHVPLPGTGGGLLTVPKDEVFVLRFDPACLPCWVAETGLRGHAVFIGPGNSAAAVRAEDVPGVKADCVYWVGRFQSKTANVFDMWSKTSARCLSPLPDVGVPVGWYWYTPGDNHGDGEVLQRQPKRQRLAEPEEQSVKRTKPDERLPF